MTDTDQPPQSELDQAILRAMRFDALINTPRLEPALSTTEIRTLADVMSDGRYVVAADEVVIGVVDRPRKLEQVGRGIRFLDGALCLLGPIASGKTTGLHTAIASVRASYPAAVVIIVDAAGGQLASRVRIGIEPEPLAECGSFEDAGVAVVDGDDVSYMTLLIDRVELALADVDSRFPAPVLLVIDGFDELLVNLAQAGAASWSSRLARLVRRGRDRNFWFACSSASLQDLGLEFRGSMKHVITLGAKPGQSNADDRLAGGRGVDRAGDEVQLAVADQSIEVDGAGPADWLRPLPYPLAGSATSRPGSFGQLIVSIGKNDLTELDVDVEIGQRSLLILGPPRSGRTSLVSLISAAAVTSSPGSDACIVSLSNTRPLVDEITSIGETEFQSSMTDAEFALSVVERIASNAPLIGDLRLICIDDAHLLRPFRELKRFIEAAVRFQLASIVVAADLGSANAFDWKTIVDQGSQVMFLQPSLATDVDDGGRVLQDSLRRRPRRTFAQGCGILYDRRKQTTLHCYEPPPSDGNFARGEVA